MLFNDYGRVLMVLVTHIVMVPTTIKALPSSHLEKFIHEDGGVTYGNKVLNETSVIDFVDCFNETLDITNVTYLVSDGHLYINSEALNETQQNVFNELIDTCDRPVDEQSEVKSYTVFTNQQNNGFKSIASIKLDDSRITSCIVHPEDDLFIESSITHVATNESTLDWTCNDATFTLSTSRNGVITSGVSRDWCANSPSAAGRVRARANAPHIIAFSGWGHHRCKRRARDGNPARFNYVPVNHKNQLLTIPGKDLGGTGQSFYVSVSPTTSRLNYGQAQVWGDKHGNCGLPQWNYDNNNFRTCC